MTGGTGERGGVRSRATSLDALLAVALSVVAQVELRAMHDGISGGPSDVVGPYPLDAALAAVTTLALAVRRLWPHLVAPAVLGLHLLANVGLPHALPFFGVFLALLVHAWSFGRWAPASLARHGWFGAVAFVATFWVHTPEARGPDDIAFLGGALLSPWLAGWVIQRLHAQRRALDVALASLAEAEEQRRSAVLLAERARIAREMHDVVGHGVSVMVVQAGSARLDLPAEASASRDSLLAIERTGREVLAELRRTVGLLREQPPAGRSHAPSPGLEDLPSLVDGMRTAGLDITLDLPPGRGDARSGDAGRELAIYRIVQEALTNALRHAGRTRVHVAVGDSPSLWVEVRDEGPSGPVRPRPAGDAGHGLLGMSERVHMYGGELVAVPDGRGFRLRAEIPWEADR